MWHFHTYSHFYNRCNISVIIIEFPDRSYFNTKISNFSRNNLTFSCSIYVTFPGNCVSTIYGKFPAARPTFICSLCDISIHSFIFTLCYISSRTCAPWRKRQLVYSIIETCWWWRLNGRRNSSSCIHCAPSGPQSCDHDLVGQRFPVTLSIKRRLAGLMAGLMGCACRATTFYCLWCVSCCQFTYFLLQVLA